MTERRGNLTEVTCPHCGTEVNFPCTITTSDLPGEDEVNWNVEDAQLTCACLEDATENEKEEVLDLLAEQAADSDYDYDR